MRFPPSTHTPLLGTKYVWKTKRLEEGEVSDKKKSARIGWCMFFLVVRDCHTAYAWLNVAIVVIDLLHTANTLVIDLIIGSSMWRIYPQKPSSAIGSLT